MSRETDGVVGGMLGLAIGDALGAPVSGLTAERIQQQFGIVTSYLDTGRTPGLYTARTQQALCLLDSLLDTGQFDPHALAVKFVTLSKALHQKYPIYGAFRATSRGFRDAVDRLAAGVAWDAAGSPTASNEAAGRVVPLALWSRDRRVVMFRDDLIRSAWLTQRDPRAAAGALAIGFAIVHLANLERPADFDARAFLHGIATFTRDAEAYLGKNYWNPELDLPRDAVHDLSTVLSRLDSLLGKPIASGLDQITRWSRPFSDRNVRATWPFVVASVPAALLVFTQHAASVHDALSTAVSLGGDTSGLGGMVGALAGTLHGPARFPRAWLDGLENAAALRQRAEALAAGGPLPPEAPSLARMEAALTQAELPRLKAREAEAPRRGSGSSGDAHEDALDD